MRWGAPAVPVVEVEQREHIGEVCEESQMSRGETRGTDVEIY